MRYALKQINPIIDQLQDFVARAPSFNETFKEFVENCTSAKAALDEELNHGPLSEVRFGDMNLVASLYSSSKNFMELFCNNITDAADRYRADAYGIFYKAAQEKCDFSVIHSTVFCDNTSEVIAHPELTARPNDFVKRLICDTQTGGVAVAEEAMRLCQQAIGCVKDEYSTAPAEDAKPYRTALVVVAGISGTLVIAIGAGALYLKRNPDQAHRLARFFSGGRTPMYDEPQATGHAASSDDEAGEVAFPVPASSANEPSIFIAGARSLYNALTRAVAQVREGMIADRGATTGRVEELQEERVPIILDTSPTTSARAPVAEELQQPRSRSSRS